MVVESFNGLERVSVFHFNEAEATGTAGFPVADEFHGKDLAVTDTGLEAEREGQKVLLKADTVIYAAGQRPLSEQALALRAAAPEWYAVGDCVTPRNILQATQQAYQIARDIGRF